MKPLVTILCSKCGTALLSSELPLRQMNSVHESNFTELQCRLCSKVYAIKIIIAEIE